MKAHLLNVYMRMPQRNSHCHPFDGSKLVQRRIEGHQRDPGSCCRGDGNSRASRQDRSRSSRYSPKRTSVFTCGLSVPTSHFQMPPAGRPLHRLGISRAGSVALIPWARPGAEFFLSGFGSERNGGTRLSAEASPVELANPCRGPNQSGARMHSGQDSPAQLPCSVRQFLDRRAERIMCMSGATCRNAAMPKKQGERQNRAIREGGPSGRIPINRPLQAENCRLEFA